MSWKETVLVETSKFIESSQQKKNGKHKTERYDIWKTQANVMIMS